jgi:hypothetical protein
LSKQEASEIEVLSPRRVPLAAERYQEAVALLAELLIDTAAKRRALRSLGVSGGASGGAMGSVISFPAKRRNARDAA